MSARLSIQSIALLSVLAAFSTAGPAWAQKSERLAIANRQRVRALVAAALADGTLSKYEEHSILLEAKDTLPSGDLRGIQRTLARISVTHGPMSTVNAADKAVNRDPGATLAGFVDSSAEDRNPFREEDDADPFQEDIDGDIIFSDPDAAYFGGWENIELFSTVTSFRNPVDLNGSTGNYGIALGFNGGFPLSEAYGIGLQVGTSAVLTHFHGWQYTYGGGLFSGNDVRAQSFTTCGVFKRDSQMMPGFSWGFAYDWLIDDYYARLTMGRWRVKLAQEMGPDDELGAWASIPDYGDEAIIGLRQTGQETRHFKACVQANFYWQHYWETGVRTKLWVGLIEEPGEVVLGADAQYPISENVALVGTFNYVEPSSNGITAQAEEMWNVAVGIAIIPGTYARGSRPGRFAPLLPIADNGNFLVRRF